MSQSYGTLHAVGVGPGDPDLLTIKAAKTLAEVDMVFAAASPKNDHSLALTIAAPHLKPGVPVERLDFPMTRDMTVLARAWQTNAETVISALAKGASAAFLTLGDPLTYSTFGYLCRTLAALAPELPIRVVPGITSYQAAAAHTGRVLAEGEQNLLIVSGVSNPATLIQRLNGVERAVILKAYRNFPAIRAALARLPGAAVAVTEVGRPGEMVYTDLDRVPDTPSYFTLILYDATAE